MKKNNLPPHISLLLLAASISLLAACAADDPSDVDALPAGKYPITLATTVEGMTTARTTVEGTWRGGEGIIGTLSKDDGTSLPFRGVMNSDGTSQLTDQSGSALYWNNANEEYRIVAEYPIGFEGVKANQRLLLDHLGSDHLIGKGQLSLSSSPLPFEHQMSKVTVALQAGEGITDLSTAVVILHSQVKAADGSLEITPYLNATALFPPQQQVAGKPFISIELNYVVYTYTPTSPGGGSFEIGKSYLYTVTVNKTGLTVEQSTLPTWGSSVFTEDVVSKQIDPNFDITNLKPGDYYYSDGTWSDGGYRKFTDETYGRLPINPLPGKVCIGIVFETAPKRISQSDRDKGYKAYVMALADAGEPAVWGPDTDEESDGNYPDKVFDTNIYELTRMYTNQEGFRATRFIIDKYGANDNKALKESYKAFYNVSQFGKTPDTQVFAAPATSSGWFLPSGGQWCSILETLGYRNLDKISSGVGTTVTLDAGASTRNHLNQWLTQFPKAQLFDFSGYWTTTEIVGSNVYVVGLFYDLRVYNGNKNDISTKARCILAF